MKVLDLNLLLYAIDSDSVHHEDARAFVERALNTDEAVALPWVVVLGFLRVSTSRRVFTAPITAEQALGVVDGWLARPNVVTLAPDREHWSTLRALMRETGTSGNLTIHSHLAALAIERGAELCSTDADFARYPRLHWVDPVRRGLPAS